LACSSPASERLTRRLLPPCEATAIRCAKPWVTSVRATGKGEVAALLGRCTRPRLISCPRSTPGSFTVHAQCANGLWFREPSSPSSVACGKMKPADVDGPERGVPCREGRVRAQADASTLKEVTSLVYACPSSGTALQRSGTLFRNERGETVAEAR